MPCDRTGATLLWTAVRSLGEACSRLARRAVTLVETRRGVGIVFVLALAVWWLEALVIPLGPGRDLGTYLGGYIQLFQAHPIDLGYVLGRTPLATLPVGGLLDLAGGALAEPVVSVLYAASIAAWFLAARTFGGRAGYAPTAAIARPAAITATPPAKHKATPSPTSANSPAPSAPTPNSRPRPPATGGRPTTRSAPRQLPRSGRNHPLPQEPHPA